MHRPRREAARVYDRIARVYDLTEGLFERGHQDLGVRMLAPQRGEHILEVGHGTGRALLILARRVGSAGRVSGLDISSGMHREALRRIRRASLDRRVDLRLGDAVSLPYEDHVFDAVFMSFTLELFDTPDIPVVLGECRRVLRNEGRLALVSLALTDRPTLMDRLYALGHERFPRLLDCRAIPVRTLLAESGFQVARAAQAPLLGLTVLVVLAILPEQGSAT